MSSGQPRILDLQSSNLLNSAINCIFLQNIQFINGYISLPLPALTPIYINTYIQKNKAMLLSSQFHKTECDKYSVVFKLYESVSQSMISVINIVSPSF